ncbi:MAG: hypothetical protein ACRD0Q_01845 [Acidimicrobiales bacterium]
MVFDAAVPAVTTAAAVVLFAWLWFVRPLLRRRALTDAERGR